MSNDSLETKFRTIKPNHHSTQAPIITIPAENVASFMDEADVRQYFRKCLNDHFTKIDREFEKCMASGNVNYSKLNDLWQRCFGAAPTPEFNGNKMEKSFHIEEESTIDFEDVGAEIDEKEVENGAEK